MDSRDEQLHGLIAERAAEWHVACSEGDLSPQQARDFMRWLRASPLHVAEFLAVSGIATDIGAAARDNAESLHDLLAREDAPARLPTPWAARDVDRKESPSPRTYRRTRTLFADRSRHARFRPAARWAASVAAIVMVIVAVGLRWVAPESAGELFATRHGEVRSLQLSDGTFVQLDSDSAIRVSFDPRGRTVVVDRGQAYFDVGQDPQRPFRVRVGESVIRDVGTAFDVYRQPSRTSITVSAGRVEVWSPSRAASAGSRVLSWVGLGGPPHAEPVADLGAGQQVVLTTAGQVARLGDADVALALAWRQGRIAFDGQPVAAVAAEFNRYNDVKLDIASAQVGVLPISGAFDVHDVPAFVAFLRTLPNITVQSQGRAIVVGAKRHEAARSH